ncbi:hypothetical protein LR48_Vigan07g167200 [Vigna angularis]|uniref:Uncharacterized protein n=2 Tax=Phaseolus angularis TaxID=3914 RepID=A0A0L9UYY7_PHAAN|nr:hypothetical protein LR48_Vigan07g167200 [Vigna angularis]BAT81763.1 hypothetical protein VIGAN_03161400 [Vigna angularis var. angularis]
MTPRCPAWMKECTGSSIQESSRVQKEATSSGGERPEARHMHTDGSKAGPAHVHASFSSSSSVEHPEIKWSSKAPGRRCHGPSKRSGKKKKHPSAGPVRHGGAWSKELPAIFTRTAAAINTRSNIPHLTAAFNMFGEIRRFIQQQPTYNLHVSSVQRWGCPAKRNGVTGCKSRIVQVAWKEREHAVAHGNVPAKGVVREERSTSSNMKKEVQHSNTRQRGPDLDPAERKKKGHSFFIKGISRHLEGVSRYILIGRSRTWRATAEAESCDWFWRRELMFVQREAHGRR